MPLALLSEATRLRGEQMGPKGLDPFLDLPRGPDLDETVPPRVVDAHDAACSGRGTIRASTSSCRNRMRVRPPAGRMTASRPSRTHFRNVPTETWSISAAASLLRSVVAGTAPLY